VKPYELESVLKKTGPAALYLIVGVEDCLRDQALAILKVAVVGEGDSGNDGGLGAFNEDLLYGDEHSAEEILAGAEEAPVCAARRLIVVKAAEKLPAREGEALLPHLKQPCDTTTLVFVAAKDKLDGRLKFTQGLMKSATLVECGPLAEPHLTRWIQEEARRLRVCLNEDAILLLKELAGNALSLVRRELEKLAAYVSEGTLVTAADVEALRGTEPGASVFDLSAAIGVRDRGRVLYILARNLEAGEAPLRILGSLAYQYRRIWKAKDLARRGVSGAETARVLGMSPYRVKEVMDQQRLFSESHLRSAFEAFLEADSKLKGGSAGAGGRVLESVLLGLCAAPRGPVTTGHVEKAPPSLGAGAARPATRPLSNVRTVRPGRPSAH
jgi:DNA polymerase-3 subunit delta